MGPALGRRHLEGADQDGVSGPGAISTISGGWEMLGCNGWSAARGDPRAAGPLPVSSTWQTPGSGLRSSFRLLLHGRGNPGKASSRMNLVRKRFPATARSPGFGRAKPGDVCPICKDTPGSASGPGVCIWDQGSVSGEGCDIAVWELPCNPLLTRCASQGSKALGLLKRARRWSCHLGLRWLRSSVQDVSWGPGRAIQVPRRATFHPRCSAC